MDIILVKKWVTALRNSLYRPVCPTSLTSSVPGGFVAEPKRGNSHCETQCVITFKDRLRISVVGSDKM